MRVWETKILRNFLAFRPWNWSKIWASEAKHCHVFCKFFNFGVKRVTFYWKKKTELNWIKRTTSCTNCSDLRNSYYVKLEGVLKRPGMVHNIPSNVSAPPPRHFSWKLWRYRTAGKAKCRVIKTFFPSSWRKQRSLVTHTLKYENQSDIRVYWSMI